MTTLHLYLHAASQPTSYLGFMRLPFIEGSEQRKGGEVNAGVAPGSQPVGATVSGSVTSKPGSYTFSIALDATQPKMATPQRIAQEVVVHREMMARRTSASTRRRARFETRPVTKGRHMTDLEFMTLRLDA
jgi:hypothetical protein